MLDKANSFQHYYVDYVLTEDNDRPKRSEQ